MSYGITGRGQLLSLIVHDEEFAQKKVVELKIARNQINLFPASYFIGFNKLSCYRFFL